MASTASRTFPPQALEWLAGPAPGRVLLLGPTPAVTRTLLSFGHRVVALDRSLVALGRAVPEPDEAASPVAAAAEALPFEPCVFDAVICLQNLHTFAPGLALAELARVLTPTGHLGVVYTTRDDTVPWVKRLAALLRDVDDTAMQGDYGTGSLDALRDSRYFPDVESHAFRTWVPVTRDQLLAMVSRRPAIGGLAETRRAKLLDDLGGLYDSVARVPEPLLLPYQAMCWRAAVNQAELSVPISFPDGLRIL